MSFFSLHAYIIKYLFKNQLKRTISPSASVNRLGVTALRIPDVATPPRGVHTASAFSPFPTSPVLALSPSSSLTKRKLTATSLTASNLSSLVTQLSVVEERGRSETDRSGNPGAPDSGWLDKRRTKALGKKEPQE